MPATNYNMYVYVFADCMLTIGASRSLICDLGRKKMFYISNSYAQLFTLFKEYSIKEIREMIEEEDLEGFNNFLDFLILNDLAELVDDIQLFPSIELNWEHPSKISKAIIDIKERLHDFKSIYEQLESLGCYFIQIRFYNKVPIESLITALSFTKNKNFRSVDLILKYDEIHTKDSSIDGLIKEFPVISTVVIHSSPFDSIRSFKSESEVTYRNRIMHIKQPIDSCSACGIINLEGMFVPDLNTYIENSLYNSCLNKKISIDENGKIKNCPSMDYDFGNIHTQTLNDVVNDSEFLSVWNIQKDKITICKDCEYRNICIDCRAYPSESLDLYSKPAKCKYDPYSTRWNS
jgi:SPASM domain peptide maturase of grasp-with-spasm system